mgnify:CR=1 FL=1
MKELSIALLNYNGKAHLEKYLPSVIQFSENHPVIVIDNGSEDDSVEFLQNHYPQIGLIRFETNHGFCGGYNLALELLKSQYVVLLNTDVEVTAGWITPVLSYMQANPTVKAAQPKILSLTQKTHFEYAGGAGGFLDTMAYPFCRGRIFETMEEDRGQYDDISKVSWASGSCLFIHRQTYLDLGGLDEHFFAHMEEIDLCWRLWNAGHEVAAVPSSTVYHLGGGTLHKSSPYKTYLNFRNGLSLMLKNERAKHLLWKLPMRLLLDWSAILKFSLQSGPKHGIAILRAHLGFFRQFRHNYKQRPKQFNRQRPYFKGLLAINYFLLKKRVFKTYLKEIEGLN